MIDIALGTLSPLSDPEPDSTFGERSKPSRLLHNHPCGSTHSQLKN
jgi:hypothetical protein